jgi:hypothetical protein
MVRADSGILKADILTAINQVQEAQLVLSDRLFVLESLLEDMTEEN